MTLTPQWLDELRSRISLSGVIGRTTRLTKAGREFKACCPFHNEKTPSFYVNDEKGFYHCFGCQAHGDAIRWLTDQRGLAFIDAVKELASEAGMELPPLDPRAAEKAEKRQGLDDVMTSAQAWFVNSLRGPGGEAARRYLDGRGFSAATLERFGFGFAPENRQALREGLRQYPEELLIEAGLRITVENKEPYDRFRGRLTLPIRNPRGQIVGFGGRILDTKTSDAPKYLNSPDTPIFDKGRTLYNFDRAGPLARKSGQLVVVEGYMDVVALANAGIEEAVAPLGTALTEAQIELAWRVCETPVLCFDGDPAGQRAAMRAMLRALPLLRPAHSLGVVRLPAGLDPDDLVKAQGPEAMRALLEAATPLVEALWLAERDAQPCLTPEDKAGLKARLLAHVDAIGHPDIRALYRRELLDRFGAWAYPPRPARGASWRPATERLSPDSAQRLGRAATGATDKLLAATISGFLRHPDALPRHSDALARLSSPDRRLAALLDVLVEAADDGSALDRPRLATILAERRLAGPAAADYAGLRFAFLGDEADPASARADLAEAMTLLVERPAIDAALAAAERRFGEDPDGAIAEIARLRDTRLALERRMMQRAAARSGASEREANGLNGGEPQPG